MKEKLKISLLGQKGRRNNDKDFKSVFPLAKKKKKSKKRIYVLNF